MFDFNDLLDLDNEELDKQQSQKVPTSLEMPHLVYLYYAKLKNKDIPIYLTQDVTLIQKNIDITFGDVISGYYVLPDYRKVTNMYLLGKLTFIKASLLTEDEVEELSIEDNLITEYLFLKETLCKEV